MTALAQVTDLELRGQTIQTEDLGKAAKLLEDASSTVRAYTGQTISLTTTTAGIRAVRSGEVTLMQRPVVSVDSVTTLAEVEVQGWEWDGLDHITGLALSGLDWVRVTYTHGFEVIPEDVIGVVCSIAARSLTSDPDPGITSEGIAGYSYSRGPITASGPWGLFDQEKAILDRYKVPAAASLMGIRYR